MYLGTIINHTLADDGPFFRVLLRKKSSNKTYFTQKEMVHLLSSHSFDGKYFKIVYGKDTEAISFNEKNEDILLKAATAYYHLNLAREFWIGKMNSERAKVMPKIIVRIDIKNQFNDLGHFAHDNLKPQFNNALSVPAGQTPEWVPSERQDKWEKEIWFRPKKKILTEDLANLGRNPVTVAMDAIRNPLINYLRNQLNVRIVEEIFYPNYVSKPLHEDVIRYAGTYALLKVIYFGSRYADPLFMEKYYYLDTAMVPEISYHEYAHIILSDYLEMSHSTAVNEGIADYFAAVQSQKRKVYSEVKGYSNATSKDTQAKRKYVHWDESNRSATSDFTLSVLWDVRETLGDRIGDQVVFEARKFLKTESSSISNALLRAIINACDLKCESPRIDKYKLYETFSLKGF